jgi:hypothetical protein
MSAQERLALHELESEVEAELRLAQSGGADEALAPSQSAWLFDPSDIERYRTGLRGLLGAVHAWEGAPEPDHGPDDEGGAR